MASLLFALVLSATPVVADNPECTGGDCQPHGPVLAIGDLQIGDPLTDAFAEAHCPEHSAKQVDRLCRQTMNLKSGGEVDMVYEFHAGELIQISLRFDPELFSEVVRRYTEVLGKTPDETWQEELVTRGGAAHTNDAVAWRTYSGPFVVKRFGSSVLEGYGQLTRISHKADPGSE